MIADRVVTDYSVWLTPERLAEEEKLWEEVAIYRLYANTVIRVAQEERCSSVIELGCGTGWVPTCLPAGIKYVGVDANRDCLVYAALKDGLPEQYFVLADIRSVELAPADLVCSFAVLKHFALAEWREVVAKMLSLGRVGVFTMNVGPEDEDDFTQGFPHTWVSPSTLNAAVIAAGHEVRSMELIHTGETMVTTGRL